MGLVCIYEVLKLRDATVALSISQMHINYVY